MKRTAIIVLAFWAIMLAGNRALAQRFSRPAPTAADWAALAKLPDFTGVWETPLGGGRPPATAPAAAPDEGGRAGVPAGPAGAGRGAAAAGGAGGGRGRGGGRGPAPVPSLTPEYAAKAKAAPSRPPDESATNCLPPGMPGIMTQPYPYEILMTPGQVTILSEAYTQVRHIYTDGRPLPEDPDPTFFGFSAGRWEDNTLVVETVGFEDVPRGLNFPHSDKMKIVERFKLTDPDTMTIETTIVDPEALTTPFSMGMRTLRRHRNWTIAEYICEENNRNFIDSSGKGGVRLDNPLGAPK